MVLRLKLYKIYVHLIFPILPLYLAFCYFLALEKLNMADSFSRMLFKTENLKITFSSSRFIVKLPYCFI